MNRATHRFLRTAGVHHQAAKRGLTLFSLQLIIVVVLGILLPFCFYVLLTVFNIPVSALLFPLLVLITLTMNGIIWLETFSALVQRPVPDETSTPLPKATAIIAAYLPNEIDVILDTIEHFLQMDYADFQVILAYNTPYTLPIEATFRQIAARDARFLPLRIKESQSKAENVMACLPYVQGAFVGIFDADHHPAPDSFRRAWRWLANGWDIVQGRCVVRNAGTSWLRRMVAVEFDVMYLVSHPGRTRLFRFGIFGGSNGYWKLETLRTVGLDAQMLTEDIDSSVRALLKSYRIICDRGIVSHELLPPSLTAFVNQRSRWAQGWFQVSLKHLGAVMRTSHLTLRQKSGMFFLLVWREAFFWLSLQMIPLVGCWLWQNSRPNSPEPAVWDMPLMFILIVLSFVTFLLQVVVAYAVTPQQERKPLLWYLAFVFGAMMMYAETKNVIARVAHVKEFSGDRHWRVTPRRRAATL